MSSEKNVVFTTAGGMELKLDIFRPEGTSKRTAIVFVHGGGWRQGSREMMWPNARAMAAHGFTGVAAQYRLTPQAPWPAQIEDVKAAIRWTRANAARLDVDPGRIVLWGSSAGAHLVLLAAGTPDVAAFEGASEPKGVSPAVSAVIAVHAPVDLHLFHGYPHGFAAIPSVRTMVVAEANHFLDRTLIDPGKYAAEMDQFALQRAAAQAAAT